MTALIDFDSILYHAVYRAVSFGRIKEAVHKFGKEAARQWLKEEVYNEGIYRAETELISIKSYIENNFFEEITSTELFITTCEKSFRKEISESYKANRKRNDYVWILREHYRQNGCFCSETKEADDLIAERAKKLGIGNYIVISIDKDLKQIGGHYWSYYKTFSLDHYGDKIPNEFGGFEREYKQKDVEFITPEEANLLFWKQMLTGDASDNIKGLHRVGEKTAQKILSQSKVPWIATAREYIKREQKQDFYINFKLLKLCN
jgi:5'-3' exonuclease